MAQHLYVKFLIYTVVLIMGGLQSLNAQNLNIKKKTGAITTYDLHVIRKITFAGGNMDVQNKGGSTQSYIYTSIANVNFLEPIPTFSGPGIKDNPSSSVLYPNPVSDRLMIKISDTQNVDLKCEILSVDGKILISEKCILHGINVSKLPRGLYFCRITKNLKTETLRFIKQ